LFEGFTRTEIETSGARIALRHGDDGPPLLLLHGNPLTHASWGKIAPRLAERFHVVAADLRGYGDSVGPTISAKTTSTIRSARWRRIRSR
jgi:haloacetate dehalogenase